VYCVLYCIPCPVPRGKDWVPFPVYHQVPRRDTARQAVLGRQAIMALGLHCTALHCTALHCTALHCIALHCIALHCTALHCTKLH
jgi:hypothetical protein